MYKYFKTIIISVIFLTNFSCRKEYSYEKQEIREIPIIQPSILGEYEGEYNLGAGAYYYYFKFEKDNKLTVIIDDNIPPDSNSIAIGMYKFENNIVTATYTYPNGGGTFSIMASVNNDFTYLSGTWGSRLSVDDAGTFWMRKI